MWETVNLNHLQIIRILEEENESKVKQQILKPLFKKKQLGN